MNSSEKFEIFEIQENKLLKIKKHKATLVQTHSGFRLFTIHKIKILLFNLDNIFFRKELFAMPAVTTFHEQTDVELTLKLREVLKTLPPFTKDYFRAIEPVSTSRTRISYAYDIRIFFQFLLEENPSLKDKTMSDLTVDLLDQITALDVEEYMEYLKVYKE